MLTNTALPTPVESFEIIRQNEHGYLSPITDFHVSTVETGFICDWQDFADTHLGYPVAGSSRHGQPRVMHEETGFHFLFVSAVSAELTPLYREFINLRTQNPVVITYRGKRYSEQIIELVFAMSGNDSLWGVLYKALDADKRPSKKARKRAAQKELKR